MNKKNIIITISSTLVASGLAYLTIVKIRNKKEINKIHSALDGRGGAYGTIEDFKDVFEGAAYLNKMQTKYKDLILLKGDYITDYRKKLYDAIDGISYGTDTDTIKSIFRNLKDKVQIAQIADSYQRNYKISLLDAIKDENSFKAGGSDMNELLDIMISKPNFRIQNK